MKVSTIDLPLASISDLLRGGMHLCDKVATKNKYMIAYDLFILLGPFALSNVGFCRGGFLKTIGFVAKPTNYRIDI
jgi:hypothetical protein